MCWIRRIRGIFYSGAQSPMATEYQMSHEVLQYIRISPAIKNFASHQTPHRPSGWKRVGGESILRPDSTGLRVLCLSKRRSGRNEKKAHKHTKGLCSSAPTKGGEGERDREREKEEKKSLRPGEMHVHGKRIRDVKHPSHQYVCVFVCIYLSLNQASPKHTHTPSSSVATVINIEHFRGDIFRKIRQSKV